MKNSRKSQNVGGVCFAALLCVFVLIPGPMVSADMIELKTGERVEGTLKHTTNTEVAIEVGGQTITFDRTRVRAIYFGAAPVPSPGTARQSALTEALKTLKGLQSVTQGGITRVDYAPRVSDARIKVDQYLSEAGTGSTPAKQAIHKAMEYYSIAANAWTTKTKIFGQPVIELPVDVARVLDECQGFKAHVARLRDQHRIRPGVDASIYGVTVSGRAVMVDGPEIIWACASDELVKAEELLR